MSWLKCAILLVLFEASGFGRWGLNEAVAMQHAEAPGQSLDQLRAKIDKQFTAANRAIAEERARLEGPAKQLESDAEIALQSLPPPDRSTVLTPLCTGIVALLMFLAINLLFRKLALRWRKLQRKAPRLILSVLAKARFGLLALTALLIVGGLAKLGPRMDRSQSVSEASVAGGPRDSELAHEHPVASWKEHAEALWVTAKSRSQSTDRLMYISVSMALVTLLSAWLHSRLRGASVNLGIMGRPRVGKTMFLRALLHTIQCCQTLGRGAWIQEYGSKEFEQQVRVFGESAHDLKKTSPTQYCGKPLDPVVVSLRDRSRIAPGLAGDEFFHSRVMCGIWDSSGESFVRNRTTDPVCEERENLRELDGDLLVISPVAKADDTWKISPPPSHDCHSYLADLERAQETKWSNRRPVAVCVTKVDALALADCDSDTRSLIDSFLRRLEELESKPATQRVAARSDATLEFLLQLWPGWQALHGAKAAVGDDLVAFPCSALYPINQWRVPESKRPETPAPWAVEEPLQFLLQRNGVDVQGNSIGEMQ